jgi:hypothetical protein
VPYPHRVPSIDRHQTDVCSLKNLKVTQGGCQLRLIEHHVGLIPKVAMPEGLSDGPPPITQLELDGDHILDRLAFFAEDD